MEADKIKESIQAAKKAAEVFDLAKAEAPTGCTAARFWGVLEGLVAKAAAAAGVVKSAAGKPMPTALDRMTPAERASFASSTMPWGKFMGRKVCEVPEDYLRWLDDQPDSNAVFRRQLRRYVLTSENEVIDGD